MATSDTIRGIKNIVNDLPLLEILETAEVLSKVIPVLGPIILVLKVLVKLSPNAFTVAETIATSVEKKNAAADAKVQFERLVDMACTDGVITDAEKEFLRPKAIAAGFSDDEFELMVINNFNR